MSRSALVICFFDMYFFEENKIMHLHILKVLDFLIKYIFWVDTLD